MSIHRKSIVLVLLKGSINLRDRHGRKALRSSSTLVLEEDEAKKVKKKRPTAKSSISKFAQHQAVLRSNQMPTKRTSRAKEEERAREEKKKKKKKKGRYSCPKREPPRTQRENETTKHKFLTSPCEPLLAGEVIAGATAVNPPAAPS
jgi:hypothetical protein